MWIPYAEASTTEEPDAGKPHVRVCALNITHKYHGLNAMIFVGNIKVVWEGGAVRSLPIPIGRHETYLRCIMGKQTTFSWK
jgi:hypothetical protein